VASAKGGTGTSLTWTHTPVSSTPTAVAVLVQNYEAGGSVTGVTYGGTAMTNALNTGNFHGASCQIWGLPNPASGAKSVVVSGASTIINAASITVTGSNTSTTFDSTNSQLTATTTSTLAVTSAGGEFIIDMLGLTNPSQAGPTANSPQTQQWSQAQNPFVYALGSTVNASGGSSTTIGWSIPGSADWFCYVAASFKK
jgi:hypothetical protein